MSTLELPGLNPLDPLGFLACLGVLVAVTEEADARGREAPRLGFEMGTTLLPRIASRYETIEQLVEGLSQDVARVRWARRPSFPGAVPGVLVS